MGKEKKTKTQRAHLLQWLLSNNFTDFTKTNEQTMVNMQLLIPYLSLTFFILSHLCFPMILTSDLRYPKSFIVNVLKGCYEAKYE